jgi:septal ring factor EnvC (AmiA/AmiB activator)
VTRMGKVLFSSLFFLFIAGIGTNFAQDDSGSNPGHVETHKKRLEEIQEELRHKRAGEKAVSRREESLLGTLSRMEEDLFRMEKELARLDSQHDGIQRNIAVIQEKLNRIQRQMDHNQARLHSRIVAMYKAGRVGYLPYLLSSDSYTDFMRMAKFLKIVIDHDAHVLRNYRAQWLEKKRYQEKSENDMRELKRIISHRERKKLEILHAKSEKVAFLEAVRREKAEYRKWIQELEVRARELHLFIEKLEKEMRDKEVSDLNFKFHKGRLSLPVRGNVIPGRYGRGIIIEAPQDSPIRAVFSGRVIFSGRFEGYGNIIILDHGDKYYTVFGHASKVLKGVNERVEEGEVIALVGDTGSIRGPCLYFEIRHKGKPENPLEWFSIPKGSHGLSEAKKGSDVSAGGGRS